MLALAAPYADFVVDARTGEVLHQDNADTRLHPASLTKMMTLYIAFEAIEHGEISLDSKVTISRHAASQPPSKLGLRPGQTIALRYLIRAAAIKSANDAATAIGEAIEGSEPAFAKRMNRTAKALGMTRTTFVNANGLTAKGHLSTARDMTILGRHVFYDYPQYYNIFSRTTADAGVARVAHTNRRFLADYKGADGIKTGYTAAAGFNLTASAQRGNKRVIVTVFGGKSTASRNARVAELMDLGFAKSPNRVAMQKPARPAYVPGGGATDEEALLIAEAVTGGNGVAAGKTIRLNTAVKVSPRPRARPVPVAEPPAGELLVAMQDTIEAVLTEAQAKPAEPAPAAPEAVAAATAPADVEGAAADPAAAPEEATAAAPDLALAGVRPHPRPALPAFVQTTEPQPETLAAAEAPAADGAADTAEATAVAAADAAEGGEAAAPVIAKAAPAATDPADLLADAVAFALAEADAPEAAPEAAPVAADAAEAAPADETAVAAAAPATAEAEIVVAAPAPAPAPATEPVTEQIILASLAPTTPQPEADLEVVTRVSTSGGRQWAINVGHFSSRYNAERQLLQTALVEANTLDEALRKVVSRKGGFDANFVGMTEEMAQLACRRLQARQTECTVIGP